MENYLLLVILVGSVLLQFWAAGLAVSFIGQIGHRNNWLLIGLAIGLMGFRRLVSLSAAFMHPTVETESIVAEIIALATSALLVAGLHTLRPHIMQLHRRIDNLEEMHINEQQRVYQLERFNFFVSTTIHVFTRQACSASRKVRTELSRISDAVTSQEFNVIAEQCEQLERLASALLRHSQLRQNEGLKESISVKEMTGEALAGFGGWKSSPQPEIQIEDGLVVRAHRSLFRTYLEYLLRCAMHYLPIDEKSTLQIRSVRRSVNEEGVCLEGPFTGPGTKELQNVREPFITLSHYRDMESGALELSVAASCAREMGGLFWVEHQGSPAKTYRFCLTLQTHKQGR